MWMRRRAHGGSVDNGRPSPPGAPTASGSLRLRVGRVDRLYVVGRILWLIPASATSPPVTPRASPSASGSSGSDTVATGWGAAPAGGVSDGNGTDAASKDGGGVVGGSGGSNGHSNRSNAGGEERPPCRRRYRAVMVDGGGAALERILVTPTLWASHMPSAYEAALESLGLGAYFDAVSARRGRGADDPGGLVGEVPLAGRGGRGAADRGGGGGGGASPATPHRP
ncbi:hypothetical protein MMPV_000656 [Pyropia vietnamensis]